MYIYIYYHDYIYLQSIDILFSHSKVKYTTNEYSGYYIGSKKSELN